MVPFAVKNTDFASDSFSVIKRANKVADLSLQAAAGTSVVRICGYFFLTFFLANFLSDDFFFKAFFFNTFFLVLVMIHLLRSVVTPT
jgi:hypothetical protein